MEKIIIVAKTHAYDGRICTGGIVLGSNRSLRLLTKLGEHQPHDSPFQIGQIWEMSWRREYSPQPPHVEDVRVLEQHFVGVQESLREILPQCIHPWVGSPQKLFNGQIVLERSSAYICKSGGLPGCSTGFWLPGKNLVLSYVKTRPYYTLTYEIRSNLSAQLRIPFVGCADPISEIPAEALIRVSLARWWKKMEEEEKKCYLQLSGWYL